MANNEHTLRPLHGWYSEKQRKHFVECSGGNQLVVYKRRDGSEALCTCATNSNNPPSGFDDFVYMGELDDYLRSLPAGL